MTTGDDAGLQAGMQRYNDLTDAAWVLAALAVVLDRPGLAMDPDDEAAQLLVAAGLAALQADGTVAFADPFASLIRAREEAVKSAIRSTLGQASAIAFGGVGERWQGQDAETLTAQGKASGATGRVASTMIVNALDGLPERFESGGSFLDVGVGVAELACTFAEQYPNASVVGLDPFPLAIELARKTIADRGLGGRVEVRQHGVEALDDVEAFDLAWLPTPFIPREAVEAGVRTIHRALRPGGWLVLVGATVGSDMQGAVTRFQVGAAGGTALTADERSALLADAGFVDLRELELPPGAPAMVAARRP